MSAKDREIAFLLGLPFNVMTMDETIEDAVAIIESRHPSYFITANVDFIAQARTDERLREILFHADRAVCDGMPLVWISRIFKPRLPERVAGSDMVFRLFEQADSRKWKVYFLGSDTETLKETSSILHERYPEMSIVGQFSPPFCPVDAWPNEAILESIRSAQPDLLLVAVGCPKQEYWISKYYESLRVPLSIGIGASLDFVSGTQVRAPLWMQKVGMEWLWRMTGNPKRLLKRYAKDFYYLIQMTWLQWRLTHDGQVLVDGVKAKTKGVRLEEFTEAAVALTELKWVGNVELSTLPAVPTPNDYTRPVLLEMSEVSFIDSSGIGCMARVARSARQADVAFGILKPSDTIRHMIEAMRLGAQFPIYESRIAAIEAFTRKSKDTSSAPTDG